MNMTARFVSLPNVCSYLPNRTVQMEYARVASITAGQYEKLMSEGWRRFGYMLFRPVCRKCSECRTLRVLVDRFQPNRSQRRVRRLNEGEVRLTIGRPSVTPQKLELYDRYHAFQSIFKEWPTHPPKDMSDYVEAYVDNPFPTREYCYYLHDQLVAVAYVDELPSSLSAIYCFYEPELRERSIGTWNVLSVIEQAVLSERPFVYLGYFVDGCRSLEYKANFQPNQIRDPDGHWCEFRT